MAWTKSQQQAIDSRGRNLLVSAAAGSGKTSVLVQRVIQMILSGRYDINRMLIVTFTNAAADEMRSRISNAIAEMILHIREFSPDERHNLYRQRKLLTSAPIQTIHSFCNALLQRFFSDVELNSQFRIGTEQELKILQNDILEDLFKEKYSAKDEKFLQFTDFFGGSLFNDDQLYSLILRLYDFSRSQPFSEQWLASLPSLYDIPENARMFDLIWWSAIEDDISLSIDAAIDKNMTAWNLAVDNKFDGYAGRLDDERAFLINIQTALKNKNMEWLTSLFGSKFSQLPRTKVSPEFKDIQERIKAYRNAYKEIVTNLKTKYFYDSTEENIIYSIRENKPSIEILCELTMEFSHRYQLAKREQNIIDFDDLEHFALKILTGEDGNPSAIAEHFQSKFQIIMVDEYQDVNAVQETILRMISREDNFFAVGDVKQSIYRFRLADPQLFMKKYKEFPLLESQGKPYEKIDLSENFRSRQEVIDTVNFLFEQLMNQRVMEIDYDDAARLIYSADYPEDLSGISKNDYSAEFYLIDPKSDKSSNSSNSNDGTNSKTLQKPQNPNEIKLTDAAKEGQLIADRIKKFSAEGLKVYDKQLKQYREFEYRDIVVLMRSIKNDGNEIVDILRKNNIPATSAATPSYLNDLDVRLMLDVLSIVENPQQNIPLAAVVCSSMCGVLPYELAKIRADFPNKFLITSLQSFRDQYRGNFALLKVDSKELQLYDKVELFLDWLREWRKLSVNESVQTVIWKILSDTKYFHYVGSFSDGTIRQLNLRLLIHYAKQFEEIEVNGLFEFLRYIRRIRRLNMDFSSAKAVNDGENAVQIMTIHQSKGLEFPIVFVARLGKKFNMLDVNASDFLIHKDLGIGTKKFRIHRNELGKFSTVVRNAVSYILEKELKSEELRNLYVALTRAKEKLILIATVSGQGSLDKKIENWQNISRNAENILQPYSMLAANNFLDWIAPALSKDADLTEKFTIIPSSEIRFDANTEEEIIPLIDQVTAREKLTPSKNAEQIDSVLSWRYPYEDELIIPSKVTVTELKRQFTEDEDDIFIDRRIIFKRPKFMQMTKLTNVEYGTLMHTVMQRIDLQGDLSESGIRKQIQNLVEREFILPEHVELISVRNVARFFKSKIGKKLLSAKQIYREIQFSSAVDVQRFYSDVQNPSATTLMQGMIDLVFFDEDDNLILLDYKTDVDDDPHHAEVRYRLQIALYSEVAESIFHHKVDEKLLYMLHSGLTISM